jgi:hypothetical protein
MEISHCKTEYCKIIHQSLFKKFNNEKIVNEYINILKNDLPNYDKPWFIRVFSSGCIYDGAVYASIEGFDPNLEKLVKEKIESTGDFVYKGIEYDITRPKDYDFSYVNIHINLTRKKNFPLLIINEELHLM